MSDDNRFAALGQCGDGCVANHFDAEILSPYYLFQGARPQLTAVPRRAVYGTHITVTTSGAVTHFAWIRMSSVTHSVNTDQRLLKPAFTALGGGRYNVAAPENSSLAPPGTYMLFALDGKVPSVAKVVRLDEENLAQGKPASQSSEYPQPFPASLAVDGVTPDVVSNNFSHSQYQGQPWWQVDLGSVQRIGRVNVWNRGDCCAQRTRDFYVSLSPDGVRWTSVMHVAEAAAMPTVLDFAGASGRYVRVQLTASDFLHLGEVEVFRAPSAPGGLPNLALAGTASQSTEFDGSGTYAASKAIDGLTPDAFPDSFNHTAY